METCTEGNKRPVTMIHKAKHLFRKLSSKVFVEEASKDGVDNHKASKRRRSSIAEQELKMDSRERSEEALVNQHLRSSFSSTIGKEGNKKTSEGNKGESKHFSRQPSFFSTSLRSALKRRRSNSACSVQSSASTASGDKASTQAVGSAARLLYARAEKLTDDIRFFRGTLEMLLIQLGDKRQESEIDVERMKFVQNQLMEVSGMLKTLVGQRGKIEDNLSMLLVSASTAHGHDQSETGSVAGSIAASIVDTDPKFSSVKGDRDLVYF